MRFMDLVAKAQTVPKPLKNFEIAGILIEALNSVLAIHQHAKRSVFSIQDLINRSPQPFLLIARSTRRNTIRLG